MTFKDYYLKEGFLSELPITAKQFNLAEIQNNERELQSASIDMEKEHIACDAGIEAEHNCRLNYQGRTQLVHKFKQKISQALILIHETEYKLSQIKKFHGNKNLGLEPFILHLCEYVRHYLMGVIFLRIAADMTVLDNIDLCDPKNINKVRKLLKADDNTIKTRLLEYIKKQSANSAKFNQNNSYDIVYLRLLKAKTLPELLIAISLGLNAEHDRGKLVSVAPDDDNPLTYEPPFTVEELDRISNINYRKLDKELQQEFN